jgi:plastocyanin
MTKGDRRLRMLPLRTGLAMLCAASAVSSCGASQGEGSGRYTIEIRAFAFRPDTLRVAAGDTLVWTNRDVVPHTATAAGWDSGPIEADSSWETVATTPDTIGYVCTLHPAMTGALIIEDRGNGRSRHDAAGG